MKKILSLALVLVMILSMVPMMFMTAAAAELTAPTTLPNGNAFDSCSFFSPTDKVIERTNTKFFPNTNSNKAYSAPLLITSDTSTDALNKDGGVMFKVDSSAATEGTVSLAFRIKINHTNGKTLYIASHGGAYSMYSNPATQKPTTDSTWYVTKDGTTWTPVTASASTLGIPIANAGETLYVYVPYSEMYFQCGETYLTTGTANTSDPALKFERGKELIGGFTYTEARIQVYMDDDQSATTITEFQFITEVVEAPEVQLEPPTTLPDGKEFATESIFASPDKEVVLNGSESNKWLSIANSDVTSDGFNNALGIMFKVDASKIAAGDDSLEMTMLFSIFGNNGIESAVFINGGSVGADDDGGYYTDAQDPTTPSIWYVSIDGSDWTTVSTLDNYRVSLGCVRGEIYVYVPFSEMYMRHSLDFFTTGTNDATKPGAGFYEAKAACGGWKKATSMVRIQPKGTDMKAAILSDLVFVYGLDPIIDTEAGIFESVNITATNDIAYNLYAKIPAGATNVNMSFLFNGKTYDAVGVEQENGTVKYTLKNVLPQYMGQDIVATWTATVGDETVTDTYTSSVEDYLKVLLAGVQYADMHDVATALLHYGAAAQTVAGSTDALVNEGVAALPHPTNCKELPSVYNNGAKAIWTSAALRLSTTITLKVGVTAPEGISKVQYTIGDKTEVVDIKNGYVYIPVNAYQMMDAITLNCYDGSAVTADGALVISASYYLNIVDTDDAAMAALLEAIANYAAQATIAAGGRTGSVEKAYSTVAQLALYDTFGGQSNVIQLTDGSFIIIDGGTNQTVNEEALWAYLWRNSGYTKPVISAWIFTHLDLDHTGLGFTFLAKYKDDITLKTIGYTFPEDYQTLFAVKEGDSEAIQNYKNSAINLQAERLSTFESIKKAYPDAELWDMTKGDVKEFEDVEAHVLLSAKDVTSANPFEHNSFSVVIQFVFTQNTDDTADDTTYLVWGDSDPDRLKAAESEYGATLKSDVMQAAHHALHGGVKSTYEKVAPEITLMPVWENTLKYEYKEFETDEYGLYWTYDFNAYLLNNSDCYFHDTTAVVNMADLTVSIWE